MDLRLVCLDEDTLYEHVFERYIELTSNTEKLKQDLGILNRVDQNITVDIEPFDESVTTESKHGKSKLKKKKGKTNNDNFYSITIEQSITSLNSSKDNNNSTTGYVLWSTTPFFIRWLLYHPSAEPFRIGAEVDVVDTNAPLDSDDVIESKINVPPILKSSDARSDSSNCSIIELGTGISSVTSVILSNFVDNYIATDQKGIVGKLKHNIKENILQINKRTCISRSMDIGLDIAKDNKDDSDTRIKPSVHLEVMPIDWETFDIRKQETVPTELKKITNSSKYVTIIAMDVIYNEYLIGAFLKTIVQLIDFFSNKNYIRTHCLIGIHLRSQDVITSFLEKAVIEYDLKVYSLTNDYLDSSRFSFYYI